MTLEEFFDAIGNNKPLPLEILPPETEEPVTVGGILGLVQASIISKAKAREHNEDKFIFSNDFARSLGYKDAKQYVFYHNKRCSKKYESRKRYYLSKLKKKQ